MKLEIKAGTTSKRVGIFIADASSNVGAGLAALLFSSTGLTWYYWREDEGNAAATAVTLVTATRGTFSSGGFIEKDTTNLTGAYEISIPDAALAVGAKWVNMMLKGAANMVPLPIEIQLTVSDPDAPSVTLTAAQNNAIADAILLRDIATGGSSSAKNVRSALRTLRCKQTLVAGTGTTYEEDGVTPAWEWTYTTAARDPLASIAPTT
ncbi:MAG: hypothetical protein PHC88_05600 [Terrimicrobiaceae bacterium]|nr:hypothetical protein [Terrimicrobiaceae bacterium]